MIILLSKALTTILHLAWKMTNLSSPWHVIKLDKSEMVIYTTVTTGWNPQYPIPIPFISFRLFTFPLVSLSNQHLHWFKTTPTKMLLLTPYGKTHTHYTQTHTPHPWPGFSSFLYRVVGPSKNKIAWRWRKPSEHAVKARRVPSCRSRWSHGRRARMIRMYPNHYKIHPWNLTWNLKITQLKRKIIWTKPPFSGSMLNFRGVIIHKWIVRV